MQSIQAQIKKISLHRLLAASVILAIIIAALYANARYISSFFKGPQLISASDLLAAKSPEQLPSQWLSIEAEKITATGLRQITVRKKRGIERSRKVSATYFLASIGEHLLVVRAHEDTPTPMLKGSLILLDSSVRHNLLQGAPAQMQDMLLPLMLDTADFQEDGYIGFTLAGLAALAALGVGGLAFVRWRNPAGHPIMQKIAKRADSTALFSHLETPINQSTTLKVGNYFLSSQFVLYQTFFHIKFQLLDELLWAYKNIVQTRLYYFIPAGKKYYASLNFQDETIAIQGKESTVEEILQHIEENAPWALIGFDTNIEKIYKKDKAQLLQIVSKRKQNVASAQPPALSVDNPASTHA